MSVPTTFAETVATKISHGIGTSVGTVQIVVTQQVNPIVGGVAAAVTWGGIACLINLRRYRKGKVTKKEALQVTACESVGMGLAAGTGLLISNTVRTLFFVATTTTAPSLVPFLFGLTTAGLVKMAWVKTTGKNMLSNGCAVKKPDYDFWRYQVHA